FAFCLKYGPIPHAHLAGPPGTSYRAILESRCRSVQLVLPSPRALFLTRNCLAVNRDGAAKSRNRNNIGKRNARLHRAAPRATSNQTPEGLAGTMLIFSS